MVSNLPIYRFFISSTKPSTAELAGPSQSAGQASMDLESMERKRKAAEGLLQDKMINMVSEF